MMQTRRTRMPLRPRSVNIETSSTSSINSKLSSGASSCASSRGGKTLSYLESSGNENNKRIEQSTLSNGTCSSTGAPSNNSKDQNSSLIANTGQRVSSGLLGKIPPSNGAPSYGAPPRNPAEENSHHHLQRESQSSRGSRRNGSSSSLSSAVSSEGAPDDQVVIVEMRRKSSGDGYTTHRYIRGRMLGKGGFAKVYLCTSEDTGKDYAVKIVPKANLVKTRARQKLQAEIKIHRTLKHKHICEYKHFFEDRTNCYILLELCANQSMNEMVKRRKRLTPPEVRYFMSQMVDAVRYMHDENVIHRDLKLGNLFLDKHLRIKVGDLGLATRLKTSDEKRKTICGTPNYIAPEVINGNKETRGHSFEVDIWSIGVICFTTLVGKPPYEAKDVKSTYQRILANDYSFPSHAKVPADARDLITAMLQTDPEKRPTLDEIEAHPFLDEHKMPASLPQTSTHVPPQFEKDEFGHLVLATNEPEEQVYPVRRSSYCRMPLSKKDLNSQCEAPVAENKALCIPALKELPRANRPEEQPGIQRNRPHAMATRASALKFKIYDDNNKNNDENRAPEQAPPRPSSHHEKAPQSKPPQHVSSMDKDIHTLTEKTAVLTVETKPEIFEGQESGPEIDEGNFTSPKATSSDLQVLEMMHTKLMESLSRAESIRYGLEGISRPQDELHRAKGVCGPKKWVTRYVDYTSKYGLGFLLNNGSAGVYFNDSTKTVHAPKGDSFMYVDRKKLTPKQGSTGNEALVEMHTTSSYPESLQKKVTLLKHFRNYLQEQQEKSGEEDCNGVPESNFDCTIDNEEDTSDALVYLKKWVRTKHAILFRLSDLTVQVVFYDHTEILLSSDAKFVTFVDKRRKRSTYELGQITPENHQDISKRLKYSKDIIYQLISGTKCSA